MLYRILMAGVLASTLALAQRGGGRSRGGDSNGSFGGFGNTSPFDRVSEMLKLSKDQKRDFKAAMDDAQKDATPVHEQILKSRQSIAEAVEAGKGTGELVKAEGVLEAQMAEIELRAFVRVAATLDEEQKPRAGGLFMMMRGIFEKKNWNSTDN